ncbi:MAG: Asp23/Gls24 family envelope stress response protein [Chloroflexi bacterium]|nr:Asp23/Gls24 family envelope stress response protein [Chloroflexota bacterium]
MTDDTASESLGRIFVSPTAIATIASKALLTSYGVVGMASKNAFNELAATITRDPHHGIDVRVEDGHITVDVYVIIQYGTRISTVASSVINAVRYNIERAVDVPVHQVNVFVQGLRKTDDDGEAGRRKST